MVGIQRKYIFPVSFLRNKTLSNYFGVNVLENVLYSVYILNQVVIRIYRNIITK